MVAFVASLLLLILSVGLTLFVGQRRAVGTPITWGEAMVGAVWVFWLLFLAYGIVPHQFLTWADKELNWTKADRGIPAGPLGKVFSGEGHYFSNKANAFWPNGVTFFGRGKIEVNQEHFRDVLATMIYGVFIGGHGVLWTRWQRRGKATAAKAAVEPVSAFGRPLAKNG
jgi:hypothetical protein